MPAQRNSLSALVTCLFASCLATGSAQLTLAADAKDSALFQRGKQIVDAGNSAGATACASCHGSDGSGRPRTGIPALAGQTSDYLGKQLRDLRSGVRRHFFMQPTATVLTDEDIDAVAHYYSQLEPVRHASGRNDWRELALGSWIADYGIGERSVPSCNSCHGENGQGVAPVFPRLTGQSATYIKRQLQQLQKGDRSNDPASMMRNVSSQLRPDEIIAVSRYYEWLGGLAMDALPVRAGGAALPAAPASSSVPEQTSQAAPEAAPGGPTATTAVATTASPAQPKAVIPAASRTMYQVRCTPCHGVAGAGDGAAAIALNPKPRSFADPAWQASVDDARLRKVILDGGPSLGLSPLMPPNPDLAEHLNVVDGLVALIRTFED